MTNIDSLVGLSHGTHSLCVVNIQESVVPRFSARTYRQCSSQIYRSAITHYGDQTYLKHEIIIGRVSYLFGIQLVGAIVQTFLISRIWRLSKNTWISLLLFAGVLLSILFQTITVEVRARQKLPHLARELLSISPPEANKLSALPVKVTAAVDDVLIAVILVYYLWQAKKKTNFPRTQNILSRLIASSLETGSLTAVIAIIVEILFQKLTGTNLQAGAVWLLGRAYSLTLTYNLLLRRDLRNKTTTHQTVPGYSTYATSNTTAFGRGPQNKVDTESSYPLEIQVTHTQASQVDRSPGDAKHGFVFSAGNWNSTNDPHVKISHENHSGKSIQNPRFEVTSSFDSSGYHTPMWFFLGRGLHGCCIGRFVRFVEERVGQES
ncbi:hypothetical protein DL96DRAFT_1557145 [Flagelloscypha sp. PMI_526]|nr:hypothetical protein DL96DRAFT_1557145 [Flagelloscypha sp. PMI_526]